MAGSPEALGHGHCPHMASQCPVLPFIAPLPGPGTPSCFWFYPSVHPMFYINHPLYFPHRANSQQNGCGPTWLSHAKQSPGNVSCLTGLQPQVSIESNISEDLNKQTVMKNCLSDFLSLIAKRHKVEQRHGVFLRGWSNWQQNSVLWSQATWCHGQKQWSQSWYDGPS